MGTNYDHPKEIFLAICKNCNMMYVSNINDETLISGGKFNCVHNLEHNYKKRSHGEDWLIKRYTLQGGE